MAVVTFFLFLIFFVSLVYGEKKTHFTKYDFLSLKVVHMVL